MTWMAKHYQTSVKRYIIMAIVKEYKVVEKNNPLAVHCITWSIERGEKWIEKYGDSKMFMDKTLNKDSFKVIPVYK